MRALLGLLGLASCLCSAATQDLASCDAMQRPLDRRTPYQTLVYNRVPKTGSSTTREVLSNFSKATARYRSFSAAQLTAGAQTKPLSAVGADETRVLDLLQRRFRGNGSTVLSRLPVVVEGHFPFATLSPEALAAIANKLDVADVPEIQFINMVRDPVARVISKYNYLHAQLNASGPEAMNVYGLGRGRSNLEAAKHMHLDDCVAQMRAGSGKPGGRYPCSGPFFSSQLLYFCGFNEVCKRGSPRALALAKENVERHFAVVGVLEEFSLSLRLFEAILPTYFSGLSDFLRAGDGQIAAQNSLAKKSRPPLDSSVDFVKEVMRDVGETEFYDFVRDLFWRKVACANSSRPASLLPPSF